MVKQRDPRPPLTGEKRRHHPSMKSSTLRAMDRMAETLITNYPQYRHRSLALRQLFHLVEKQYITDHQGQFIMDLIQDKRIKTTRSILTSMLQVQETCPCPCEAIDLLIKITCFLLHRNVHEAMNDDVLMEKPLEVFSENEL